ncbi:MAG: hypothetical protein LC808_07110 [Actinobacteria bacterium]|nr:hypothetical protein [Actinomycetota bacterium]
MASTSLGPTLTGGAEPRCNPKAGRWVGRYRTTTRVVTGTSGWKDRVTGTSGWKDRVTPSSARRTLGPSPAAPDPCPQPGAHCGVVEGVVEHHPDDLIEQHEPVDVGAGDGGLALLDAVPGAAVSSGEGLVEHLHQLVDDSGVHLHYCRQQGGMAALGGHLAQRPGRGPAGERSQLAAALRWDSDEVEAVRPERAQVGEFGQLGLDGVRRRAGGPFAQPHQWGHALGRVRLDEAVELFAARGGEL